MIRREKRTSISSDLNMETATREQRIAILCQIIKSETEKPIEDRDTDLIFECSEFLNELTESGLPVTNEELEAGLAKIKTDFVYDNKKKRISNIKTSEKACIFTQKLPRKWIKVAIACILALTILTPTTVLAIKNDAFSVVSNWVKDLFHMGAGKTEIDGITIIKGSESKKYSSIEELILSENLDIMYPTWLPDGIKIRKVWQTYQNSTDFDLNIVFSDNELSIIIRNYALSNPSQFPNVEVKRINGLDYYIVRQDNGKYFATCQATQYEYTLLYPNYDELIEILEGMKGLKK